MWVTTVPYVMLLDETAFQRNSVLFFCKMCSSERSTKKPSMPMWARIATVDWECPNESAAMATLGVKLKVYFKK